MKQFLFRISRYISQTTGLRVMDVVMRNNNPNFLASGTTLLERLGHEFHMSEVLKNHSTFG